MIKCEVVEKAIREAMKDWLKDYILQINSEETPKAYPIDTALETVQGRLAGLLQQQDNLCEYLEKRVYTIEVFNKRNTALAQELKSCRHPKQISWNSPVTVILGRKMLYRSFRQHSIFWTITGSLRQRRKIGCGSWY